jgi:hypothetical protein
VSGDLVTLVPLSGGGWSPTVADRRELVIPEPTRI